MTNEERKAALEAIIYAADEPVSAEQLATALGEAKPAVQAALDELVASYAGEERGIEIRAVAGGYKMYRSEEHTSELQSRPHLVCRLLLEKKKKKVKRTGARTRKDRIQ